MRDDPPKMTAEMSVYDSNNAYVGVEALDGLRLRYNDEVRLTFPDAGINGSDIQVEGFLTKPHQLYLGKQLAERVREVAEDTEHSSTVHIEGIVEKLSGTWEDEHGLTESRWDKVFSLPAKLL